MAELAIEPGEADHVHLPRATARRRPAVVADGDAGAASASQDIHINYIGPVIGSHTGPNTMGLFFVGTGALNVTLRRELRMEWLEAGDRHLHRRGWRR